MNLASITGQVRFLLKGDKGDPGNPTPILYPYGEYNNTIGYTRDDILCPMVLEGTIYYALTNKGTYTGVDPQTDVANNGGVWFVVENYQAILVNLLIAAYGKIASAVFYGNYMFSQQGKDASGNDSSNYSQFGTGAFIPNILLDFLTGTANLNKLIAKNAEISGTIISNVAYTPFTDFILDSSNNGTVLNPTIYGGNIKAKSWTADLYLLLPPAANFSGCSIKFYNDAISRSNVPIEVRTTDVYRDPADWTSYTKFKPKNRTLVEFVSLGDSWAIINGNGTFIA